MPVDRKDIEITKEVPSLLQKMERGKFYNAKELYFIEYGLEFNEEAPDTDTEMWGWWWNHNLFLALLVVQGKILTGIVRDEVVKTTKTKRGTLSLPRTVYYGLP